MSPGGLASGLLRPGPTHSTEAMSLRPPISLLRAALPLAALVTAAVAGAQTITLNVNNNTSVSVGKNDCNATLTFNWTVAATGSSACTDHQDLVVWVTKTSSCGTDPAAGDATVGTVPQSTWSSTGTGSLTLAVSALPVFAGTTCPVSDIQQDMKVCAYAKYLPLGAFTCLEAKPSTSPTITYDSQAPAAPVINSVVPQDGALVINFTASTDSSLVTVAYEDAVGPYTNGPSGPAASGSIRLDGLTNGTTYAVLIYAEDAAGNQSPASNVVVGTPVQSYGFFESYQQAGGRTGGCAAAPAGALPLLALAWMSRRRRRSPLGGRRS